MNLKYMHPADQIVSIMDRIYKYKYTTTSGGNLSILDDNGDIWISPSGIDKGNLTREMICRVSPDGTVHGPFKPSVELPFHSLLYKTSPHIKAVLHAHPASLVAFSLACQIPDTRLTPTAYSACGKVLLAEYEIPGSMILGEKIAEKFKEGADAVMMANHGVVVGKKDLFEAYKAFESLELCATAQISANQIGAPKPVDEVELKQVIFKSDTTEAELAPASSQERELRYNMCKLIRRAYDQQLFFSTCGTMSQRLDGDTFIITPAKEDRLYIEPIELVKIQDGTHEKGKVSSNSQAMHAHIYKNHPEINSIIMALPPSVMAFALTGEPFDSRTIPESYIMLRDIPRVAFSKDVTQTDAVAKVLKPSVPVVLIDNVGIVTTGDSMLQAFDRLEVAEFSARAILATQGIGKIVKINQEDVEKINEAFNLPE